MAKEDMLCLPNIFGKEQKYNDDFTSDDTVNRMLTNAAVSARKSYFLALVAFTCSFKANYYLNN